MREAEASHAYSTFRLIYFFYFTPIFFYSFTFLPLNTHRCLCSIFGDFVVARTRKICYFAIYCFLNYNLLKLDNFYLLMMKKKMNGKKEYTNWTERYIYSYWWYVKKIKIGWKKLNEKIERKNWREQMNGKNERKKWVNKSQTNLSVAF